MVIEGLKFKNLVYGMLARARDNICVKDRLTSESRFTNKNDI